MQNSLLKKMCIVLLYSTLSACGSSGSPDNTVFLPPAADQDTLSRIESIYFYSAALNQQMGFDIYLPEYYNPEITYPVLYVLYGYGGNQHSMMDGFLDLNRVADALIASKEIEPLIIVVPNYHNSFGVNSTPAQAGNSAGGTIGFYEDYLIGELLPYIDSHYSTVNQREGRFIDGYSMGGFAALYLGLSHRDLFSKIGAHSAALWDYSSSDLFVGQRDWLYATPELRTQRDPFLLVANQQPDHIDIYLDVGQQDPLHSINHSFYQELIKQGIPVDWHSDAGGHDHKYWDANGADYLRFY